MIDPDLDTTDKRKNDEAWSKFFDSTAALAEIGTKGYSYITANQLSRYAGREPRLLAKLDTIRDLPKVFVEHSLTIFPVRNGTYILFLCSCFPISA